MVVVSCNDGTARIKWDFEALDGFVQVWQMLGFGCGC